MATHRPYRPARGIGVTYKMLRVSRSVDALMVLQDHIRDWPGEAHILEDVVAQLGVLLDQGVLDGRETARLGKDFSRDANFAEVVNDGRQTQSVHTFFVEAQFTGHVSTEVRYPTLVSSRVGIALIDCLGDHLDGLFETGAQIFLIAIPGGTGSQGVMP
jgi:hypothetical protein